MAFLQRSAREQFFSELNPELQDGVKRMYFNDFHASEEDSHTIYPYNLPQKSKNRLIREGFDLPIYAYKNHTHPACKSIENYILHFFFTQYVNKYKSVCVVSMKNSKREFVSYKMKDDVKVSVCNRIITSMDEWRYGGDHLAKFPNIKERGLNFFLFDELHYWSPVQMYEFLKFRQPRSIMATVVYPAELLVGVECSLNPELYTFELNKRDKNFWFFPDGSVHEGYQQSIDSGWILKVNEIFVSGQVDLNYKVTLLRTIGAHHLVLISKENSCVKEKERNFGPFSNVPLNTMSHGVSHLELSSKSIDFHVLKKVLSYLLTLKKPDAQSAVAKLRQLVDENFSTAEILFVRQLEREIEIQGAGEIFGTGWLSWISEKIKNLVDPLLLRTFGVQFYRGFTSDLFHLDAFRIKIKCQRMGGGTYIGSIFSDVFGIEEPIDSNLIRNLFNREELLGSYPDGFNSGETPFDEVNPFTFYGDNLISKLSNLCQYSGATTAIELLKASSDFKPIDSQNFKSRKIPGVDIDCCGKELVPFGKSSIDSNSMKSEMTKKVTAGKSGIDGASKSSTSGSISELKKKGSEVLEPKDNSCLAISLSKGLLSDFTSLLKRSKTLYRAYLQNESLGLDQMQPISDELNVSFTVVSEVGVNRYSPSGMRLTVGTIDGSTELCRDAGVILFSNGHFLISNSRSIYKMNSYELDEFSLFSLFRFVKNSIISSSVNLDCYSESFIGKQGLDKESAKKLIRSMLNGTTGAVMNSSFNEGWRSLPGLKASDLLSRNSFDSKFTKLCNEVDKAFNGLNLSMLLGIPGSGKSRGILLPLRLISNLIPERFLFISPRSALKEEVLLKLGEAASNSVKTFELALLSDLTRVDCVILDEIGLYPRGYVDLIIIKWVLHKKSVGLKCDGMGIFVMGDPLQADYHKRSDEMYLSEGGEMERCLSLFNKPNYRFKTFRLQKEISDKFGFENGRVGTNEFMWEHQDRVFADLTSAMEITGLSKEKGKVNLALVPSDLDVLSVRCDIKILTYGQSQGLNCDYCLIGLSARGQMASDAQALVALTRAIKGFCFFLIDQSSIKNFLSRCRSGVLSRYLKKDYPSLKNYIRASLGDKFNLSLSSGGNHLNDNLEREIDTSNVIACERDVEDKLEGDPWLKGLVFLGQDDGMIPKNSIDSEPSRELIKCHLPRVEKSNFALRLDKIKCRESREFRGPDGWSRQFIEERGRMCRNLFLELPQCSMVRAIYPRHYADDEITFWAAVKKRLVFSNYSKEKRKFQMAEANGKTIFNRFLEVIKLPCYRSNSLFEEAQRDFELVKLSKNKATISNHSGRSDPDWAWNKVLIFMKSQLCSKFEKRFSDAKAGQTLACFSHQTLCRFNAWCRYTEKVLSKCLPRNIYIHQRKNFSELNSFVRRFYSGHTSVESDYEAFDASQDATILQFEVNLIRHIGWPEEVIEDYKEMKFSLFSKLGSFAVMRFTGEFCTFLFNTLANMAFTFMRYDVKGDEPMCFAGDDMCCLRNIQVSNKYDRILKSLSLKAKVQRVQQPTFCGWLLTQFGIVKRPELILERLIAAAEVGQLEAVMDSYFLELTYGYSLGECLFQVFCENEIEDQYQLIRFFVKNKDKLRGESFSNIQNLLYLSDDE